MHLEKDSERCRGREKKKKKEVGMNKNESDCAKSGESTKSDEKR